MDDLSAGVHACIRPSRAVDRDWLVCDFRNRRRETCLDATAVTLLLPADEIRTVVLEPQGYSRHRRPGASRRLKRVNEALGLLLLAAVALVENLFENAARTLGITHVDVGTR